MLCRYLCVLLFLFFFFFQAEDGIRDLTVTGVQTCALPISHSSGVRAGAVVSRQWASRLSPRNSPTFVSVLLMLMARSMGGVSIDGETRGRQAALSLLETRGPTKGRAALINLRDSSPSLTGSIAAAA